MDIVTLCVLLTMLAGLIVYLIQSHTGPITATNNRGRRERKKRLSPADELIKIIAAEYAEPDPLSFLTTEDIVFLWDRGWEPPASLSKGYSSTEYWLKDKQTPSYPAPPPIVPDSNGRMRLSDEEKARRIDAENKIKSSNLLALAGWVPEGQPKPVKNLDGGLANSMSLRLD